MPAVATGRYELIATVVVVVGVTGVAVGGKLLRRLAPRADEQQCQQLLDRYIEQASRQRHPDIDAQSIQRTINASSGVATRATDVASCRRDLSATQVVCGLAANNIDEMERCLQ